MRNYSSVLGAVMENDVKKVLCIAGIFLCLILIGCIGIDNSTPEKTVTSYYKAIKAEQWKQARSLVNLDESTINDSEMLKVMVKNTDDSFLNTEITEYEVYTESEEKVNNSIQSARVVLKYSTNQDSKVNEINYLIEKSEGGYKISPDTIMTPKGYNVSFDVPTGSSLKIGDRVIDDNFRNKKNKDVYDLQQLFYGDYPMEYVADDIQGNPTKKKISWSLFGVSSNPKIDTKDWMLTDAGKSKAKEEANSSITKINEYLLNDLSESDAVTILGGEENSMLKYNLKSLKSNNLISEVAISDEEAYLNSDGLFVVPFIQTVTKVKKEIEDPFGLNSAILEKYKEMFPYTLNWELIFKKDQGKLKIVGIERRGD